MKKILITCVSSFMCSIVFAQASFTKLKNGLTTLSGDIISIIDVFSKLVYVACTVMGIVAIVNVYQKYQNKDPDASKHLSMYGFGIIIVIGATTIIRAVFL